ncbi:MAG: hypothetical protein BAA01_03905 [Bacillus thermozeamaize]|uniref:Transglycosylase SLT domain-containing protein n=1 Tax=Bacillus thermozeamaize TaxID=230954 RepID=A0A1Y3PKT3_9BACI|nr:MAG: hypothetical protein BAA01_03905 [Bacillus thermozeamaize]
MRYGKWIVGGIVLILLVTLLYSSLYQRLAYPLRYQEEIWQAASQFDVDPYLVAAVIQTESRYKKTARSSKGALGLMQLMPETAKWALRKMGYSEEAWRYIQDPVLNIEVGTWYLGWLLDYYDENMVAAIAAYNAGQGAVDRWLADGLWDAREETVGRIPYSETRQYVRKVFYYYDKYRAIYQEKHPPKIMNKG